MKVRASWLASTLALAGCSAASVPVTQLDVCEDGLPVQLDEGHVLPITHEPAGAGTLNGFVSSVGLAEDDGIFVELDVGGTLHRFVVPTVGNPPAEVGTAVTMRFTDEHDGSTFRTALDVDDEHGHPIASYVHAYGELGVAETFQAVADRYGSDARVERRCATDGGACGRRGARYDVVWPTDSHASEDGWSFEPIPWQLEDDDAESAPTCDTPPRAAFQLEVHARPPLSASRPPVCASAPAFGLGAPTAPAGPPSIIHTPEGPLEGDAVVRAVTLSTSLSIVLDVDGVEHRIEIPGATQHPGIAADDHVQVSLTAGNRETLVIRSAAGGPLALYTRGRGFGTFESTRLVADTFGATVSLATVCRAEGGGQCGRSAIVSELVIGSAHLTEGETGVVPSSAGPLSVAVHALTNDADAWAESACAIGALVADSVDAVVAR